MPANTPIWAMAGSKTDNLIYDAGLKLFEEKDGHSGTPDDRWAFTTKLTALDYGSIGGARGDEPARSGL